MITQKTIVGVDLMIMNKLLNLDSGKSYYLYADEGGMIGIPTFKITSKPIYEDFFEKLFQANKKVIKRYIVGRLCTWQIGNNQDYSKDIQIIILK